MNKMQSNTSGNPILDNIMGNMMGNKEGGKDMDINSMMKNMMGGMNNVNVNQFTEGTLFIDFIDKEKKELIWQGVGSGALRFQSKAKKEEAPKPLLEKVEVQETKKDNGVRVITRSNG